MIAWSKYSFVSWTEEPETENMYILTQRCLEHLRELQRSCGVFSGIGMFPWDRSHCSFLIGLCTVPTQCGQSHLYATSWLTIPDTLTFFLFLSPTFALKVGSAWNAFHPTFQCLAPYHLRVQLR
jgi:hypothetical protein